MTFPEPIATKELLFLFKLRELLEIIKFLLFAQNLE